MNQYSEYDDTGLLPLLNRGDRKAFEAIYDRYADGLYRYVFNRVRIKEDSEEIVQEVFTSLWAKHDTLEITTSLSAYLYSISKHKIFNYIRSDKVWKKYAADFTLFLAERYDNSVEELMNVSDVQAIIESSISELPDKCQTVFRLSRKEHLSIQLIAERMNISTRTVENYLSQALKHLRGSLGEFLALIIWFGIK
jgi:RNA polymerase sigma-70 factor (family 1)